MSSDHIQNVAGSIIGRMKNIKLDLLGGTTTQSVTRTSWQDFASNLQTNISSKNYFFVKANFKLKKKQKCKDKTYTNSMNEKVKYKLNTSEQKKVFSFK